MTAIDPRHRALAAEKQMNPLFKYHVVSRRSLLTSIPYGRPADFKRPVSRNELRVKLRIGAWIDAKAHHHE